MNMNVYWTVYIVAFLGFGFVVGEGHALMTGRKTLSRFTWELSKAWPPLPWVCGVLVGFLACHFWWGGVVCFAPVK